MPVVREYFLTVSLIRDYIFGVYNRLFFAVHNRLSSHLQSGRQEIFDWVIASCLVKVCIIKLYASSTGPHPSQRICVGRHRESTESCSGTVALLLMEASLRSWIMQTFHPADNYLTVCQNGNQSIYLTSLQILYTVATPFLWLDANQNESRRLNDVAQQEQGFIHSDTRPRNNGNC